MKKIATIMFLIFFALNFSGCKREQIPEKKIHALKIHKLKDVQGQMAILFQLRLRNGKWTPQNRLKKAGKSILEISFQLNPKPGI